MIHVSQVVVYSSYVEGDFTKTFEQLTAWLTSQFKI